MTTISEEEKKRQIDAYLRDNSWLPKGIKVADHPDYFAVNDDKVIYAGKRSTALTIDDSNSKGDVVIPKGVDGAIIVYTPPLVKNVLVDKSPHGFSGRHEQQVKIEGDNNRVTFAADSVGGKAKVTGKGNVVVAGKGNDEIELFLGNNNKVDAGSGNDVIIDQSMRWEERSSPYRDGPPNSVSGGEGTDAYRLQVYRGYKDKALDTRMKDKRVVNLTFDAQGAAHVANAAGNKFAIVGADVERFEVKLEKGDIAKDCADDIYRIDLKALREAFQKSNVTLNGEAVGDITPVRIEVAFGGVKASAGKSSIRVQKIPGKCTG